MKCDSLRKHPFLLALRCWGRFTRRNVCDFGTPWLPDLLRKHWLRHQYGISAAESQTFLRLKRPQRQGARMFSQARNVTTRAFRTKRMSQMSSFFFLALVVPPNFIYCGKRLVGLIGYLNHLTFSSELTIISLVKCQPFSSTKTAPFKFHTNKIVAVLSLILYRW